jgi:hypothetical protein
MNMLSIAALAIFGAHTIYAGELKIQGSESIPFEAGTVEYYKKDEDVWPYEYPHKTEITLTGETLSAINKCFIFQTAQGDGEKYGIIFCDQNFNYFDKKQDHFGFWRYKEIDTSLKIKFHEKLAEQHVWIEREGVKHMLANMSIKSNIAKDYISFAYGFWRVFKTNAEYEYKEPHSDDWVPFVPTQDQVGPTFAEFFRNLKTGPYKFIWKTKYTVKKNMKYKNFLL